MSNIVYRPPTTVSFVRSAYTLYTFIFVPRIGNHQANIMHKNDSFSTALHKLQRFLKTEEGALDNFLTQQSFFCFNEKLQCY